LSGEAIVKDFSQDVLNALSPCIPSGNMINTAFDYPKSDALFDIFFSPFKDPNWSVGDNVQRDVDAGLITSKVVCLIESLLEYR